MNWMKLLVVVASLVSQLVLPGAVDAASNPKLKLQILPINCVFETVNDGKNTINYITPEECGVIIEKEPSLLDSLSSGGGGRLDIPVAPFQLSTLKNPDQNDAGLAIDDDAGEPIRAVPQSRVTATDATPSSANPQTIPGAAAVTVAAVAATSLLALGLRSLYTFLSLGGR